MKQCIAILAILITMSCAWNAARADDKSEIAALYKKLEAALKAQKFDATLALEAPGFAARGADGKLLSANETVAQMKQENRDVKSVKSMTIKITSESISRKTAKVSSSFKWVGLRLDSTGSMGPRGATHEMGMTGDVQNQLVKTAAGWKFQSMQMNIASMSVDGRPMAVGSPPPASLGKR